MEIQIGNQVERLGSVKDYVTGRTGVVVEVDEKASRARVRWTRDKDGDTMPGNGVRTWVNFKFLRIL